MQWLIESRVRPWALPSVCCALKGRPNPQGGLCNFDTFPFAVVNVYAIVSVSNWIYVQMPLWSTTSYWCMVYFFSLILFGSYFALSLVLVSQHE